LAISDVVERAAMRNHHYQAVLDVVLNAFQNCRADDVTIRTRGKKRRCSTCLLC